MRSERKINKGNWKKRQIVWVFWDDGHVSELCEKWICYDSNYAYTRSEELRTRSGEVIFTREDKATTSKDKSDTYIDIDELQMFKYFSTKDKATLKTKAKTNTEDKDKTTTKTKTKTTPKTKTETKTEDKDKTTPKTKTKTKTEDKDKTTTKTKTKTTPKTKTETKTEDKDKTTPKTKTKTKTEDKDKITTKTKTKTKDKDTLDKINNKISTISKINEGLAKVKVKVTKKTELIYGALHELQDEIYTDDSWLRLVELNKIDAIIDEALNVYGMRFVEKIE